MCSSKLALKLSSSKIPCPPSRQDALDWMEMHSYFEDPASPQQATRNAAVLDARAASDRTEGEALEANKKLLLRAFLLHEFGEIVPLAQILGGSAQVGLVNF